MPFRGLNLLTARQVQAITRPGRHADGGGLFLRIDKSGRKAWTFLYQRDGRAREASLGTVSGATPLTLAQAREAAAKMRADLAAGHDPIDQRRARRDAQTQAIPARKTLPSFAEYAATHIARHEKTWRGPKSSHQWSVTLLGDACAPLHALPVDEVRTEHVLQVLSSIWLATPETARRVRQRIEAVLNAAASEFDIPRINPARWAGHLQRLLPKQPKGDPRHHAAMDWKDVPQFVAELRQRPAFAARAMEFLILCASRTSEVLGMRWQEVDLASRVWVVPAERMKGERVHRVPLSDRAMAILREMETIRLDDIVFPGTKAALSNMAFSMLLRRMGRDGATAHGFRSAFRVWAATQTAFPAEVAEAALAHVSGSRVVRAYQRSDLIDQRRALMQAWADFNGGKA